MRQLQNKNETTSFVVILTAIFMLIGSSCIMADTSKSLRVNVSAPGNKTVPRSQVEIERESKPLVEIESKKVLPRIGSRFFYITDTDGNEIVSQITHDSLILFKGNVPPGESRDFFIHACDSARYYPPTVWGDFYPKRRDDIAFENEVTGYRIYGPGTKKAGEKSYGYDLFLKHPTDEIVLPELYALQTDHSLWVKADSLKKIDKQLAEDFKKSFSYHVDHGKGMDCYAVGATLGDGVAALMINDTILYPWVYEEAKILDNGPLRFCVEMRFDSKDIPGLGEVTEYRIITLDSDSHLNDCIVWFEGLKGDGKIVAGFPLRDDSEVIKDLGNGIIAYADPTQGPDNGKALVGVMMQEGVEEIIEKDRHALLVTTIHGETPLKYKWGFAWDRTDIPSLQAWKHHLESTLASPSYTVTITGL